MTNCVKKETIILIVGAIPYPKRIESYGGATVLLQNFLDFCDRNHYPYIHIPTNKFSGRLSVFINPVFVIGKYLLGVFRADITLLSVSKNGASKLFPILFFIANLFNKKFVFRIYGGNFDKLLSTELISKKKQILSALSKISLILAETKTLVHFFESTVETKVIWFPNVRDSSRLRVSGSFKKKFVFISHVISTKGINEILEVSKLLPNGYNIDIYGPILGNEYTLADFESYPVSYKGALKGQEVLDVLSNNDVLLLPSYNEGYPGIVIEAFSIGMPVIATNVGGIPEILQNDYNGILISPKSVIDLRTAILTFNNDNYSRFSVNALNSFFENFDAGSVNQRIYSSITMV